MDTIGDCTCQNVAEWFTSSAVHAFLGEAEVTPAMRGTKIWAPGYSAAYDAVNTVLLGVHAGGHQVQRDPTSKFSCTRYLSIEFDVTFERYKSTTTEDGPWVLNWTGRIVRNQTVDQDTGQVCSETMTFTGPAGTGTYSWAMDMGTGTVTESQVDYPSEEWYGFDMGWLYTASATASLGASGGTAERWTGALGGGEFMTWYKYHESGTLTLSGPYTIFDACADAIGMLDEVPFTLGATYTDETDTERTVADGTGCQASWVPAVANVSGKHLVLQYLEYGISVNTIEAPYGVKEASFGSATTRVAKSRFRNAGDDVYGIKNMTVPCAGGADSTDTTKTCTSDVFEDTSTWKTIDWTHLATGYGYCYVSPCSAWPLEWWP
jgi:hypothetical protein